MTDIKSSLETSIEDVSSAVAAINATQAGIAALRDKYEKVIFPVDTPSGMKDAKAARQEIREPRYEIERLRKEAKAPILQLGRDLDARAKDLTAQVTALEGPIDAQIKDHEAKIEAEKQAKIDAELKRVETIQDRITEIRGAVAAVNSMGAPSSEKVGEFIKDVEALSTDGMDEFEDQGKEAKTATLATLRELHAAAIEREAEQERIRAERAELEKLRAEQAERDAKERAEREAKEAEERKAREEADRKERERLDAERKEQEAERTRIAAEQQRIEDERRELEAEKERERKAKEKAEREAAERKAKAEEAARKAKFPGINAVTIALSEYFSVPEEVAAKWISELRSRKVA